jgi:hypothetical protein
VCFAEVISLGANLLGHQSHQQALEIASVPQLSFEPLNRALNIRLTSVVDIDADDKPTRGIDVM